MHVPARAPAPARVRTHLAMTRPHGCHVPRAPGLPNNKWTVMACTCAWRARVHGLTGAKSDGVNDMMEGLMRW